MHIPDNYLSPSTCAVADLIMLPIWAYSVKRIKLQMTKKSMPLLGIGAAFSFLIMMFNIPLPGGTSGHAVGGTLVALLLGPEAACISISIALLIQALIFGDGGILAFGANCFNMAFIMPFTGYYIFKLLKEVFGLKTSRASNAAAFISSYIAINISALFAAIEFGIQPLLFKDAAGLPIYCPYPLNITIPAMLIPHLTVAGILEGIITAGVYGFVRNVSSDMIYKDDESRLKPLAGVIMLLACLTPLGLLAKGTAFGEWSRDEISSIVIGGRHLGFVPKGIKNGFYYKSLMSNYSVKGIPSAFGYILSAVIGTSIIVILFKLIRDYQEEN